MGIEFYVKALSRAIMKPLRVCFLPQDGEAAGWRRGRTPLQPVLLSAIRVPGQAQLTASYPGLHTRAVTQGDWRWAEARVVDHGQRRCDLRRRYLRDATDLRLPLCGVRSIVGWRCGREP